MSISNFDLSTLIVALLLFVVIFVVLWKLLNQKKPPQNQSSLVNSNQDIAIKEPLDARKTLVNTITNNSSSSSSSPIVTSISFDSDKFKRRYWEGATLKNLEDEFECSMRMVKARLTRYELDYSELDKQVNKPKKTRVRKKETTGHTEELKKIEKLLESGAINNSEYEIIKAKLKF